MFDHGFDGAVFLVQHKNNIPDVFLTHLLGQQCFIIPVTTPASALVDYGTNTHITVWFSDMTGKLIVKY